MEINKEEVERRFRRSRISYNDNARVQKMVVNRMIPMILSSVKRVPEKILEIGCGTGLLTSQLQRTFSSDGLYLNDLVEELCYHAATVNRVSLTHCFPSSGLRLRKRRSRNYLSDWNKMVCWCLVPLGSLIYGRYD